MEKKTIVISGSTRGIGHGLAIEFLKKGHQVVLNGRDERLLDKRVEELSETGSELIGLAGDISEESTFQKLIDHDGNPVCHQVFYEAGLWQGF